MLFNEEAKELISESNRYARTVGNNIMYTLTENMLKKLVAILFFTGYHQLLRQYMYWEDRFDTSTKLVSEASSRGSFENIRRHLPLADNDNLTNNKFAKVLPLYDVVNKSIKQFGFFHNSLSIDKQMIPYFGKRSAKQTLREKTVRFGFKSFILTSNDGYCYHTIPYEGAKTGTTAAGAKGKDLTEGCV